MESAGYLGELENLVEQFDYVMAGKDMTPRPEHNPEIPIEGLAATNAQRTASLVGGFRTILSRLA